MSSQASINNQNKALNTSDLPKVKSYLPFIGSGLKFVKDSDQFLKDAQAKFGDIFRVQLGPKEVTFLMNPLDYSEYFKHSKVLSSTDLSMEIAEKTFGLDLDLMYKLSILEKQEDVNRKRLQGSQLDILTERMQKSYEKYIVNNISTNWTEGSLRDLVSTTIFVAGGEAIFGENTFHPQLKQDFDVFDKNFYKLVRGTPLFALPKVKKARERIEKNFSNLSENASEIMKQRRKIEDGAKLPTSEQEKYAFSLFWAAQSNSVLVAYYTVRNILRNEEAKKEVMEEVKTLFAEASEKTEHGFPKLTTDYVQKFKKLISCIYETLRLTVSPVVMRECYGDISLNLNSGISLNVKPGEFLAIYPRLLHLNNEVYENPEEYQWNRFIDKLGPNSFSYQGEPLKYNLLPFGGGSNICPGRHFVLNEFVISVAELLYWFDFELLDTQAPQLDFVKATGGAIPPLDSDVVRVKYRRREM